MGKGSSAPKTPDYASIAREEAAGNLDLAKYVAQQNRVNQSTPWGSLTWSNDRTFDQAGYDAAMNAYLQGLSSGGGSQVPQGYDLAWSNREGSYYINPTSGKSMLIGGSPGSQGSPSAPDASDFWSGGDNWTQTVTLSPEQQALFDQYNRIQQGLFPAQNNALSRVNQAMASGFDTSALPQGGQVYDPTLATNNATDLILQRLNPQLDQQQEQLRARLANQGITADSQAYNNALYQNQQGRNDAYNQAALAGIGLGMQQQGLQFNQSEQARQRAFQEQAYLRQLPLSELSALMGGTQVSQPQFPGYSQMGQVAGPNLSGAAQASYQGQLNSHNAQQASQSSLGSGLGGLAGGALGFFFGGPMGGALGASAGSSIGGGLFSDRRLKRDIRSVGAANNGLTIYSYRYVWGEKHYLGYMADEVAALYPEAVSETADGYKMVDYSKVP